MFQWSKKVIKSVTFDPGVADESLLALVESYLEKEPDKTFSDLCKEALWQSLCVPESVKPTPKPTATPGVEKQIAELQNQIADLEERFFAKESHRLQTIESHMVQLIQQVAHLAVIKEPLRLETIEGQVVQLSQQVSQLAMMLHQTSITQSSTPSIPIREVVSAASTPSTNAVVTNSLQEDDPLIRRLSQYLDDF